MPRSPVLVASTCALLSSCGFGPPSSDPGGAAGAGSVAGDSSGGGAGRGGQAPLAGTPGAGGTDTPPLGGAGKGGGSAGGETGEGGAAGSGPRSPFMLLWRDDFDSFDSQRWSKATHTFDENLATFTAANVVVEGGLLKLRVTNDPAGGKPYSAAEVLSKQTFAFGRFEGRIKFCAGSGLVSSLFTYKEDVSESWQEVDVEHLGYLPKAIQYNLISGTFQNRVYQPKVVMVGFSPAAEFHDYAIEWTPEGISFFVDGQLSHTDAQPSIKDAANLRMNAWPTNNAVTMFAGPLDTSAIPCQAEYDWVSVSTYSP